MSDSILSLPWLPKETALLEFLQKHCDKDHPLNDYRKDEIISISLIRQQSEYTSQDKLSLKK